MTPTTYFIGGIATDKSLYSHQLEHIPNSIYLPFPKHSETDTMATYVLKFLPSIDTTKPFNIVGCSMGGIMVMELLNHINPEKVILISSVKNRAEMPWKLRQLKQSRLHKLLSGNLFIKGIEIGSRFLPEIAKSSGLRKQVIEMAHNNTPDFLNWCVHAIVNWEGKSTNRNNLFHIHGDKDRMFPIKPIKEKHIIKNGTHNMLLTQSAVITDLLLNTLNKN